MSPLPAGGSGAESAVQPHPLSRGIRPEQQTPRAGDTGQAGQGRPASHDGGSGVTDTGRTPRRDALHAKGIRAQRLKRVFGIDIETGPACGGAMRIIACIEDPGVLEKILAQLDAKAAEPETSGRPPCRAVPQQGLFDRAGLPSDNSPVGCDAVPRSGWLPAR